jgi:alkylation response protein AidB-like acyl-CoA dehydrogenase
LFDVSEVTYPPLVEFLRTACEWLDAHVESRAPRGALQWGQGSDRVSLFRNSSPAEERAQLDEVLAWQRAKFDAGYGAISYPVAYGGAGLPPAYESEFRRLERGYAVPNVVDVASISLEIEAPTILTLGTEEQKRRWLAPMRRGDLICCQLFSEPGAGSDLGSIVTKAVRDGDEWVINGQKVWTSGAQHAHLGYVICRTDAHSDRRSAFTAFVIPMDAPGVTVRPLRQMTGGSCFNEVFFDNARVGDANRIGEVGSGWNAMMVTLAFERNTAAEGGGGAGPDIIGRLMMTAQHQGLAGDPLVRQGLAHVYAISQMRSWTAQRAAAKSRVGIPGPEGSISKLTMTRRMQSVSALVTLLLGPALVADTGEWGTYAWSELVCSIPGVRLGGGSDEIQKNTIAERALGLPREPRISPKETLT